ncbi:hypothetical protein GLYMA_11G217900v4 [Glycine max]|uniref:Uncharacterized protein n=1 Tax=Glycine max TaxID=3847 RepID=A0A0R0HRC6_SOYBN|nr:hypothetical protein GYH30_032015 [Glycine max]KRH30962.1 hypothetical protein GLYMA_11G217900v4 [Glycine max]
MHAHKCYITRKNWMLFIVETYPIARWISFVSHGALSFYLLFLFLFRSCVIPEVIFYTIIYCSLLRVNFHLLAKGIVLIPLFFCRF